MTEQRATIEINYNDIEERTLLKRLRFRWCPVNKVWHKSAAHMKPSDTNVLKAAGLVPTYVKMPIYDNNRRIDALASRMASNRSIGYGLL